MAPETDNEVPNVVPRDAIDLIGTGALLGVKTGRRPPMGVALTPAALRRLPLVGVLGECRDAVKNSPGRHQSDSRGAVEIHQGLLNSFWAALLSAV